jgi:Tol biopolymer transport system component
MNVSAQIRSRRILRLAVVLCGAILLCLQGSIALADVNDGSGDRHARRLLVWSRYDPATDSVRLVIGRPDGSQAHDLTSPGPGIKHTDPVRSPDGRSVVFNVESADSVDVGIVYVTRPDSFRIIDTHCSEFPNCAADINPRLTRDGRHLVFTRVVGPFDPVTGDASSAALYVSNVDGSNARRLASNQPPPLAEDTVPRYSPDGTYMVFVRDQRINGVLHFAVYRMSADGSRDRRLTPWSLDADRPTISPALHGPSAGLIAFETHGGAAATQGDIVTIPANCPTVRACTHDMRFVTRNSGTDKSSFAASWSPTGRRIAFTQQIGDETADVWTADWNGLRRERVTDAIADPEFSPAWTY